MRRVKVPQLELPACADSFNLSGEAGIDGERLSRQWREAEARRLEAEAYQRKMQLALEQCPGFVGGDAPPGPGATGKVLIEPAHILEASAWLRRRFHVSESLELSGDMGLVFEIAPRNRRVTVGRSRVKVRFGKPEQFQLCLA